MQHSTLSQNDSVLLQIDDEGFGASVSIVEPLVGRADSCGKLCVLKVMITAVS